MWPTRLPISSARTRKGTQMKIVSVVGARPQFIKSAPVSRAISAAGHYEYLLHTGQHYDYGMSAIFFEELGIKEPSINLGVGSGSHAQQTGQMLVGIESVLLTEKPDFVLVYGDTNSTLAGALAAAKLQIKLAHVEAGLRSYNRRMPEEHNRVLTDHCADILFCPTQTAVENLRGEGISTGVYLVGDTMYDAAVQYSDLAKTHSTIMQRLGVRTGGYLLLTIHRANNTDDLATLESILSAFHRVHETVIFPIHPRTKSAIETGQVPVPPNVLVIDPVGYLDMLMLEQNARMILTDSGGIQKEAYFFKVPCITLRSETEWVETTINGWNQLVGSDPIEIMRAINSYRIPTTPLAPVFGDGHSSEKIVTILSD
jgi:UDP-N-acetylglucosamine 2-epimerase